jgi:hypothetical protein
VSELERSLARLGRELDWPPTPEFRVAPAPARSPFPLRRSLALALLTLLLLAGTAYAAIPGFRDAVRELFGLQGVTVERRERLPSVPLEAQLRLGERVESVAAAAERLGFEPLVPVAAGSPDSVHVRDDVPGGELSIVYGGQPRVLVTEFRGDFAPEYLGKIAGAATRVERLSVDGGRALWISGAPHFFFYRPPGGEFAERRLRLARNVLLLERGDLLVRLEGSFGRARALELARSLRPSGPPA